MFSVCPSPLWWLREYMLCLIIIIKSEVLTITHCLGLRHETMVCTVCFSIFLWKHFPRYWPEGPLCGEFTGHRWVPRTKASDAELWCFLWFCALNKLLSKQSWGWWFETPLCSLWGHCNVYVLNCSLRTNRYFVCRWSEQWEIIWWTYWFQSL